MQDIRQRDVGDLGDLLQELRHGGEGDRSVCGRCGVLLEIEKNHYLGTDRKIVLRLTELAGFHVIIPWTERVRRQEPSRPSALRTV
jgi:hypothetical protein